MADNKVFLVFLYVLNAALLLGAFAAILWAVVDAVKERRHLYWKNHRDRAVKMALTGPRELPDALTARRQRFRETRSGV
ncbi:MAG TPA: hypothetical protein VGF59_16480 [Bryobacteraceae bacterium]|jgi:hypothetical protein